MQQPHEINEAMMAKGKIGQSGRKYNTNTSTLMETNIEENQS